MSKLQIEYRNITELIPYDNNPRNNKDAIAKVAASIEEFGFKNPIIIDENDVIVAGHTRLLAAESLGYTEVPTLKVDDLTPEQIKAFRIADNKVAEIAEWDEELLAQELEELKLSNYDLEMTGFELAELGDLLEGFDESSTSITVEEDDFDPSEMEEEEYVPFTKRGQVWQLGRHRLMCGDSTSVEDVHKLMDGVQVDLLITDPPYNVAYEGKTKDALKIQNDSMDDSSFREFLKDAFTAADSVMKPGAVFYIWHADSEGYNFRGACRDTNWKVRQCLIWVKNTIVMGRQDYHWKHEPCLYGWKEGAAHFWASDRKQSTVLNFDKPRRNGEHPTMKPIPLFDYQIKNNTDTQKNNIVLDLFGGSGTTIIACEQNGRIGYSMELDERYCDVIIKRWEEFTGEKAVLLSE